jgi:Fur family ferric uptake transcriptional regulator
MESWPRMTKQRQVILEELRMMHDHPTADELYERVRARMPRISLGTVYRNLDMLAGAGTIRRLENTGSQMRFDGDLHDHPHVRCISCGRIVDIDAEPEPTDCDREIVAGSGFRLVKRRVEYVGICLDCDAKQKEM